MTVATLADTRAPIKKHWLEKSAATGALAEQPSARPAPSPDFLNQVNVSNRMRTIKARPTL